MSLNWDLTGCKDHKALTTDAEWPITDALIFAAMFTDIGWELTEANAAEFYARIKVVERTSGALLNGGDGEDRFITTADVRRRIGMKVNVSPVARAKWLNRWVGGKMNDDVRIFNYEEES